MIDFEELFPGLYTSEYKITSPFDTSYNCIAWAANDTTVCWDPDPFGQYYWPTSVERQYTIEAFCNAYKLLGYEQCDANDFNPDEEKIALFADESGIPTHAARQLPSGRWTSKIGRMEDIEHDLHALQGEEYGYVKVILQRTIPHS